MRILSLLWLTTLLWVGSVESLGGYITNNEGTAGSPGTFVSILDQATNEITGYVDCTGFDLTHPIDIRLNGNQTKAYVVCDTVNSVFVIDVSLNQVVGKVTDTLNPFNAPIVIKVNLNVTPNIAYVTNQAGGVGGQGSISILNLSVDLVTGKVVDDLAPVNVPIGMGISDDGTKLYVCNLNGANVSVIDTATNAATQYVDDTVNPFVQPILAAWSGNTKAYVSDLNFGAGFVNVIVGDVVTGTVSTGIFPPFVLPVNIVEGPTGTIYITDIGSNNVYEVDPMTDAVTHIFTGGTFSGPLGVAITSDNQTAYVANQNVDSNSVSIVDVTTRMITDAVDPNGFPFFTPYQVELLTAGPPPPPLHHVLRPICIQGVQKTNRFAGQSELYNTITWCASPSLQTTHYNIYRDGVLIETVSANGPLLFEEHDVSGRIVYGVTAVLDSGDESPAVTVTLP